MGMGQNVTDSLKMSGSNQRRQTDCFDCFVFSHGFIVDKNIIEKAQTHPSS